MAARVQARLGAKARGDKRKASGVSSHTEASSAKCATSPPSPSVAARCIGPAARERLHIRTHPLLATIAWGRRVDHVADLLILFCCWCWATAGWCLILCCCAACLLRLCCLPLMLFACCLLAASACCGCSPAAAASAARRATAPKRARSQKRVPSRRGGSNGSDPIDLCSPQ